MTARQSRFLLLLVSAMFVVGCVDSATDASGTTSTERASSVSTNSVSTNSVPTTEAAAPDSTPAASSTNSPTSSSTRAPNETLDPTPIEPCQPGPVPESAGLDPFYAQGCDLDGFWVVAAEEVDPDAIIVAGELVSVLFANDEALAEALRTTEIRLGIIGRDQRTTEMPEYRDLNEVFPETDWDSRARGLGATLQRPLVSAGEENLLCLSGDRYRGEDILLHEFAHVLHEWGYATIDPTFQQRLDAAYAESITQGLWADTYAEENEAEYWAEAVQSYFARNLTSEVSDGVHGPIDTRAELADADPTLHALIDEKLGTVELPTGCNG